MTHDSTAPAVIWLQDGGDYAAARSAMDELTWCVEPIDERDTAYVRADLHQRAVELLRAALIEVRAEAQAIIFSAARRVRQGNLIVPDLDTLSQDDLDLIRPLLALLRRAEPVAGRLPDGAPWLDELLDEVGDG